MIYSDTDIWQALHNGDVEIKPFDESQLGTNSYDVCLGNWFYEVSWDSGGPFFFGPYHFEDGDKVFIPVGGTLLGMTKEKIATSGKVGAELRSRSTTRRKGITTNCDAGLGDIGYGWYRSNLGRRVNNGHWTIELTAFISNGRPHLIVGERIAQIVFFECKSAPTKEYEGQYQVDWPENMIPKEWRHRVYKSITNYGLFSDEK